MVFSSKTSKIATPCLFDLLVAAGEALLEDGGRLDRADRYASAEAVKHVDKHIWRGDRSPRQVAAVNHSSFRRGLPPTGARAPEQLVVAPSFAHFGEAIHGFKFARVGRGLPTPCRVARNPFARPGAPRDARSIVPGRSIWAGRARCRNSLDVPPAGPVGDRSTKQRCRPTYRMHH
jgi:hypothetical protein